MKRKLEKIQKWNFKLAFRFGKILKIINARCGRRRFLRFWSTWSGVGHPEMPPSCLELNSDDFPFFRNLSSTSRTKDSFFGSCYKKSSSSSSRLIKRNENCWQPPARCPLVDKEQKANTKRQIHKYKVKYKDKDNVKYTNTLWPKKKWSQMGRCWVSLGRCWVSLGRCWISLFWCWISLFYRWTSL